jgi:hypothetical protein
MIRLVIIIGTGCSAFWALLAPSNVLTIASKCRACCILALGTVRLLCVSEQSENLQGIHTMIVKFVEAFVAERNGECVVWWTSYPQEILYPVAFTCVVQTIRSVIASKIANKAINMWLYAMQSLKLIDSFLCESHEKLMHRRLSIR